VVPDLVVQLKALLAAHYRDTRPTTDGDPDLARSRRNHTASTFNINDGISSSIPIPAPPSSATIPTDSARAQAAPHPAALPDTIDWNASLAQMPLPSSSSGDPFDAMAQTELDWAAFFPQQFLSDFDQGLL
jgi:hypothetical protein